MLMALGGLTLTAGACNTVAPPVDTAPLLVGTTSPAPVADQDWFYYEDGGEARLVYGLAESDDLRLGLDCRDGSGRLTLSAVAGPDAQPELHLESGGETQRFTARSEPSQLHDGVFLTANAATREPVFQRFRQVSWIALWLDGERQAYAPHPGSASRIERFFSFCG